MVRVESKGKEEMEDMSLKVWEPTTPIENAWFAFLRSELKIKKKVSPEHQGGGDAFQNKESKEEREEERR